MNTEDYKWDNFTLTYYYPVKVEELFNSWTTSAGLESFFIQECRFLDSNEEVKTKSEIAEEGDSYTWKWRHDFEVWGKVLKVLPNKEFVFSFGEMKVQVLFQETKDGSVLFMKQSNIANNSDGLVMGHLNCRSCWTFFMTNLKSVYLTGTDLRHDDPLRVSSMEVGYAPAEMELK